MLCLSSLHPAKLELGSKIDTVLHYSGSWQFQVCRLLETALWSAGDVVLLLLSVSAGVGGNLVAVQASRISTYLHMSGMPGESSETAPRKWPSPCTTFFGSGIQAGC